MARKNFAFRFAWFEAIAHLPREVRLEVIEATVRYAETGTQGTLSAAASEAFDEYILPDFRRRAKAAEYRTRRKTRLAEKAAKAAAIAAERARIASSAIRSDYFHPVIPCSRPRHRPEVLGPPPRSRCAPASVQNNNGYFCEVLAGEG